MAMSMQEMMMQWFFKLAQKINADPNLMMGFEYRGRSMLIIFEDQTAAAGLLLDASGNVRIVDPGTVNASLIVKTPFRTFMDIMDAKITPDQAYYYADLKLEGSRSLADMLMVKSFLKRLQQAGQK